MIAILDTVESAAVRAWAERERLRGVMLRHAAMAIIDIRRGDARLARIHAHVAATFARWMAAE